MADIREQDAQGAETQAVTESAERDAATDGIGLLEFVGTCFDDVPETAMTRLLTRSERREVRAGQPMFPSTDQAPRVGLILMGTARVFLTAADGRQLTVRYARRGAVIGKYAMIVGAHPPIAVHALTDCTLLEFDVDAFGACLATELSISSAIAVELGTRLEDVYAAVGDSAFGSIRQRLIRHMLALATEVDPTEGLSVTVTQQQLAAAIGSSREVVARELRRLRDDGLISAGARGIRLLNIDRLVGMLNSWQAQSPY